jgi:hypothetical protein
MFAVTLHLLTQLRFKVKPDATSMLAVATDATSMLAMAPAHTVALHNKSERLLIETQPV